MRELIIWAAQLVPPLLHEKEKNEKVFYNTSCSSEAASNTKSRNSWKIKQKHDLERWPVTLDRQCKTTAVNTQRQYFQVTPYNLLTSPDQRTFLTQDDDFSAHALSSLLDGQVSFLVHVGDGEGHEHALFPHGSRDECSRQHCNETTPEHQLILHSACEKCAVIVEDVGLRNKTHRGKLNYRRWSLMYYVRVRYASSHKICSQSSEVPLNSFQ